MLSNGMVPSPLKPHVFMLPYPLQGHITPLMQLSKLLCERGFQITFVLNEFNVRRILAAKQELVVDNLARLGIRLLGIPDVVLGFEPHDCLLNPDAFVASLDALQAGFDEVVGRTVQEQLQISCIISDSFLPWSQDVANKWHIPRVSFWPQSLASFACSFSVSNIMAEYPHLDPFQVEVYENKASEMLTCIPGIPSIAVHRLPFQVVPEPHAVDWLRDAVCTQMERVSEPLCIICNSFPALESEVHAQLKEPLLPKPLFTLGPLLPSAYLGGQTDDKGTGCSLYDEQEECLQWLDSQLPNSVLYISLGSVHRPEEQDALEIAAGLKASKVPYLWVIRHLTAELRHATEAAHGKLIQWAPQLQVLSHKAVGGFFTHCGWNSTLEGISLGVPVIAWPQMMDQNTHCWLQVEKLQIGVQLDVDASYKVKSDHVKKAVRILMQEEEGQRMRARAHELSSLAKRATATTLVSNLDSLVQLISSPHKRFKPV